jgi:hypothetical protein
MRNGVSGRSRAAGLLLLAPFVLFGLLVPPTPEAPYGDDFDYAATAWHLADTGVLRLSDWPTTMLASHAAWGALFCRLGGDSYLMLRLSMFALSALTSYVLFLWARRLGHSPGFSAWCAITFAVNPLTVSLQYTFLTDMTGSALGALLVLLGRDYANEKRPAAQLGYGALGGIAYLGRQTAAIPYVIVVALTLWQVVTRKGSPQKLVCMLAPCLALVVGFRTWITLSHGVPANHRFQFLQLKGLVEMAERLTTLVFGLGVVLAPLAAAVVAIAWPTLRKRFLFGMGAAGVIVVVAALFGTASFPMEYQGEIFDLGLHAIEFPAGDIPPQLRGPNWDVGGTTISALRTALLIVSTFSILVLVPASFRSRSPVSSLNVLRLPSLATLSFLANASLLMLTWVYVDRYLLSLIPLAIMIVAERTPPEWTARRFAPRLGWAFTLVMGLMSLIGIQDGMQRADTFWSTARLLHSLDVRPDQVDAGLSYGGHFRYSPTYRGPKHIGPYLDQLRPAERQLVMATYSPLSLDANRPVCISFGERENYRVVGRRPFRTWFRSGDVRVLVRNGTANAELPPVFLEWIAGQESTAPQSPQ